MGPELLGNEPRAIQQAGAAVAQAPQQLHTIATDEGDAGQIEAQPCPEGQDRLADAVQLLDPRADNLSLEIQYRRLQRACPPHDFAHLAASPASSMARQMPPSRSAPRP